MNQEIPQFNNEKKLSNEDIVNSCDQLIIRIEGNYSVLTKDYLVKKLNKAKAIKDIGDEYIEKIKLIRNDIEDKNNEGKNIKIEQLREEYERKINSLVSEIEENR